MSYEYESAVDRFPDQYAHVWAYGVQGIEDRFERGLHDPGLVELLDEDAGELHHQLFNEDYFIIGTYRANEFLNGEGLNILAWVVHREMSELGEVGDVLRLAEPETLAGHFAYWAGWEVIQGVEALLPNIEHFEEVIR